MRKFWGLAIILALFASLLTACSGGGGEGELKKLGKDEKATIKVMFWDENYFFQQYGSLFISKFPNIDVEVVNLQTLYSQGMTDESFAKFVKDNKPDVLMLTTDQYEKFAADGKLYDLGPVIEQDKYKTDTIHPAVLSLLRGKANGKLLGLAPSFNSQALFYNVDLFDKYKIAHPTDSMSWSEVLNLAKQFPTDGDKDNRIYGFSTNNSSYFTPFDMLYAISGTENLRILSPDGSQATLASDSWKRVYETVVDAVKSKAVFIPDGQGNQGGQTMEDYLMQDLFVAGKSAMEVNYPYIVDNIKQAQSYIHKDKPLNWGIVTVPVDPNNRGQSSSFSLNNIFSVSADSPNPRAAWEFVQYVSGEDFARVKARSNGSGELLTRTSFIKEQDGRSLEPFYKLEPRTDTSNGLEKAPAAFYGSLTQIVNEELGAVIDDKKSIDEAAGQIQERAQDALTTAKEQEKAAKATAPASTEEASASPAAAN
ncbi:ABC transporter substrate-binding protein [Cohnella sp. AR92]|uniref:ABC transporter substrate-binding protein n=1 Tax=Cohnella sp. AR92 TaxID=648716 RepID=UPI00131507A1|nr:extracellular solute-binding protein [Cohnella sp. AR92]